MLLVLAIPQFKHIGRISASKVSTTQSYDISDDTVNIIRINGAVGFMSFPQFPRNAIERLLVDVGVVRYGVDERSCTAVAVPSAYGTLL
jgi:hypothetical protein